MVLAFRDGAWWLNVNVSDHAHVDDDVACNGPTRDAVPASTHRGGKPVFDAKLDGGADVLGIERRDEEAGERLQLAIERPGSLKVPVILFVSTQTSGNRVFVSFTRDRQGAGLALLLRKPARRRVHPRWPGRV